MKKIIFVVMGFFSPFVIMAATNDFIASSNITVSDLTFGVSTTSLIFFSGSTAESITFSSDSLLVVNPGSTFTIGSADASVVSVQVSQSSTVVECANNVVPGTSYVAVPTASGAYTITPSSSSCPTSLCSAVSNVSSYNSYPTCGAAICNSGYNLSGSGSSAVCLPPGGGGIISSYLSCNAGYVLSGSLCVPINNQTPPNQTLIPTTTSSPLISKQSFQADLYLGVRSDDVRNLQIFLARDNSIYPEGLASGYFGSLTRKAIERFQLKYSIAKIGDTGFGRVGPSTRAKINELIQSSPAPTTTVSGVFSSNIVFGMKSTIVSELQNLLRLDITLYPEGIVSGYFGPLTRKAVERFQIKYGVVASDNDPGYGIVGPKTRLKLQEVFGS